MKANKMTNMQPVQTNNVVPVGDPFEAYADAVAPRYIVGKFLRFAKGDYQAGEANELVSTGTQVVAALDELMIGWIKWFGGKPAEHIMVRVLDAKIPPKREQLGADNLDEWEIGADGKPRDPWSYVNYLPIMAAQDGALYTFTTSSRGGIQAIGNLARRYAHHRKRNPLVFPLIGLSVGSYQHPNPQFGRIKFPDFTPAGYVHKTQFYEAVEAAGIVMGLPTHTADEPLAIEAKNKEPPAVEREDAFADEIPF
jgi:hypothetical protein